MPMGQAIAGQMPASSPHPLRLPEAADSEASFLQQQPQAATETFLSSLTTAAASTKAKAVLSFAYENPLIVEKNKDVSWRDQTILVLIEGWSCAYRLLKMVKDRSSGSMLLAIFAIRGRSTPITSICNSSPPAKADISPCR